MLKTSMKIPYWHRRDKLTTKLSYIGSAEAQDSDEKNIHLLLGVLLRGLHRGLLRGVSEMIEVNIFFITKSSKC